MVAHERLPEQPVTMKGLFAKSRSFSNLAAFLDLNGIIILLVALEVRRSENFSFFILTPFFIRILTVVSYRSDLVQSLYNSSAECAAWLFPFNNYKYPVVWSAKDSPLTSGEQFFYQVKKVKSNDFLVILQNYVQICENIEGPTIKQLFKKKTVKYKS